MDGFRDVLISKLVALGVAKDDIYYGNQLSKLASNLPSYFRATKNWDILICKNAHHKRVDGKTSDDPTLIVAIEFKSQDKSIGNNQNNRIEESIGNAHDFWASYENQNFQRLIPRPWLGYLLVGSYGKGDESKNVTITQPIVPVDQAFISPDEETRLSSTKIRGVSYAERYRIFLERMLAKKMYDGACFVVTDKAIAKSVPNYRVLYPHLSGEMFLDAMCRHVKAYYFD